jgi:threonine/homoserine/homoserine lactone efflux protein
MSAAVLSAAAGCAIGFVGAIPPGPAGMAIATHAAAGRQRRAISVALGAATVDVSLCAAIALGAGPILARVTDVPVVRVFLALAYAALGVFLLAETLLRRSAPKAAAPATAAPGYLAGVLRGVTNPSLVANWTLVVTALTAAGALAPGPVSAFAFALGVGVGVVGWFVTLARVVARAPRARSAPWLRAAAGVTGVLLVVGGGVGTVRALFG